MNRLAALKKSKDKDDNKKKRFYDIDKYDNRNAEVTDMMQESEPTKALLVT